MSKTFKLAGTSLAVEIGKVARQADGSAWLTYDKCVVMSTAVYAKKEGAYLGFFPLTVEYRDKASATGRFPGGYIKREGRLSDDEVLISRIIDRSVRPLFPSFFLKEVQLMTGLVSYDGKFPREVLGIIASSIALISSGLPFNGPVGAAIITENADGKWEVNPDTETVDAAKNKVTLVGNASGICMVEAEADHITNEELMKVIDLGEAEIKKQVDWQLEIKKELAVPEVQDAKMTVFKQWAEKMKPMMPTSWDNFIFDKDKNSLAEKMSVAKEATLKQFIEAESTEENPVSPKEASIVYSRLLKDLIPGELISKGHRFDFRKDKEIREINSEIDLLPCAHGSALFTRGQTQALASLTLGSASDAQKSDTLFGAQKERNFMLQYNFPPYSTGEIRPLRGVGRREIGHGYLAEKSFTHVLPEHTSFPYTIRSVVDLLESNGSSSMATICATSLALMDAGVPVKEPISGIAMGLLKGQDSDKFMILSDITGTEDAYGIMDLKVAGNKDSITAIQMDIKSDSGLSKSIISEALEQARVGRAHILDRMSDAISTPKVEVAAAAPKITVVKVSPEKIGAIIGPSGKHIKEITAKTNSEIDISDDGTVKIFSKDRASGKTAENWVKALGGEIKNGSVYHGTVSKVAEFGIFVTIVPGKDGLVHISTVARHKQDTLADRKSVV